MKKGKSTAQKMIDTGQWIVIIAVVLGFMTALVIGVWYAFNWTMQTAIGVSVLELCARVGLAGEILLILAPFILIVMVWIGLFGMPCMDMC
jgi:hypothetical protein